MKKFKYIIVFILIFLIMILVIIEFNFNKLNINVLFSGFIDTFLILPIFLSNNYLESLIQKNKFLNFRNLLRLITFILLGAIILIIPEILKTPKINCYLILCFPLILLFQNFEAPN